MKPKGSLQWLFTALLFIYYSLSIPGLLVILLPGYVFRALSTNIERYSNPYGGFWYNLAIASSVMGCLALWKKMRPVPALFLLVVSLIFAWLQALGVIGLIHWVATVTTAADRYIFLTFWIVNMVKFLPGIKKHMVA